MAFLVNYFMESLLTHLYLLFEKRLNSTFDITITNIKVYIQNLKLNKASDEQMNFGYYLESDLHAYFKLYLLNLRIIFAKFPGFPTIQSLRKL